VSVIQDETSDIIQDLRDEISKLRDRIASASEPKKDDVLKMEVNVYLSPFLLKILLDLSII